MSEDGEYYNPKGERISEYEFSEAVGRVLEYVCLTCGASSEACKCGDYSPEISN